MSPPLLPTVYYLLSTDLLPASYGHGGGGADPVTGSLGIIP